MATLGPMQSVTILSDFSYTTSESNTSYEDTVYTWSDRVHVIGTSILLALIILSTIIGNVLVIAAIVLERNLRNVANYLISSLAVADLMVAALVMPLAAVYEVSSEWFLGPEVCDMWISFDVLCCTSSILHLVAISIDRYWAVTQADYIHNRSSSRILIMVALSWGVSALISIPPLFGSRDPKHNPDSSGLCLISQDWTYTVFSTIGAFYLPLILMMIIYLKVYNAARSRIRKRHFRRGGGFGASGSQSSSSTSGPNKVIHLDETHLLSNRKPCVAAAVVVASAHASCCLATGDGVQSGIACETSSSVCILPRSDNGSPPHHPPLHHHHLHHLHHHHHNTSPSSYRWEKLRQHLRKGINGSWISRSQDEGSVDTTTTDDDASFAERKRRAKEKLEAKRERKAARTLAIVTGTFVICWLPFFIVALVRPFCGEACAYPRILVSIIGWLGYVNSLLNPVIYTIFNPDFRLAFRKILFGKYRRSAQNRRISMRLLRR